jgi:4-hydroxymandelate synthase
MYSQLGGGMQVLAVDHVEFYVADAAATSGYLCGAFGFRLGGRAGPETGMPEARSMLLRQGAVDLVVTEGLVPSHPATVYIARHGDGVAKVALRVPDAADAFQTAVRLGAAPLREPTRLGPASTAGNVAVHVAEVAGFGDVSHPLISREPGADFLPGVMRPVPASPPSDGPVRGLDHVAVCLPAGSLGDTVDFYRGVFGLQQIFEEYIEVGRQGMFSKVVQDASASLTLTLIEPDTGREPGQIDGFLSGHGGAGVQHLAFGTDDIIAAVRLLRGRGVQFLDTPITYYDRLAERLGAGAPSVDLNRLRQTHVLVDRDHWGELFQIFSRSVHDRGTFFLELIDRRGARTFGSGNIRALYEAVERDRVTTHP